MIINQGKIRAKVCCDECQNDITVNIEEMDFETLVDPRQMGAETTYYSDINFDCPRCGNDIGFKCSVHEYPTGSRNFSDKSSSGATVTLFDVDQTIFHDEEEDF